MHDYQKNWTKNFDFKNFIEKKNLNKKNTKFRMPKLYSKHKDHFLCQRLKNQQKNVMNIRYTKITFFL
jgi:hypothetical protein